MTTVTAAEFNQRPSQVKRAAEKAPVVVTEHGRPTFVLLTYRDYERLTGTPKNLAAHLEMSDDVHFDIDPVGLDIRPAAL